MAKAKTLADLIGNGIAEVTHRRTWWDDLDATAQAELTDVRQRFQRGEFGPKAKPWTVAKMLVPMCETRGWKVCDTKRMSEWLREKA